jgi:hypothetical protein
LLLTHRFKLPIYGLKYFEYTFDGHASASRFARMQSVSQLKAREGRDMSQADSIRELSVSEIDEVAGGLTVAASASVGVGLEVNGLGSTLGGVGKALDSTVTGLLSGVTGALTGVL